MLASRKKTAVFVTSILKVLLVLISSSRTSSAFWGKQNPESRKLYEIPAHHRRWTSDLSVFLKERNHQPLTGIEGGVSETRNFTLNETISRVKLKLVHLDNNKIVYNNEKEQVLKCQVKACPDLSSCQDATIPAKSCLFKEYSDVQQEDTKAPINCPLLEPRTNPSSHPKFDPSCSHGIDFIPHEKVSARIVILYDVYINSHGHLFNNKYHFLRGGCGSDSNYTFTKDTKVKEFKEILNLAHWNAYAFFHGVVELLPAFLQVSDILHQNKGIPVAHRNGQHSFLETVGLPLLGIRAKQLNIHEIKDDALFFAHKVYQPLYAPCARPSRVQWKFLRAQYLVPQNGLPIFNPNWTLRKIQENSDDGLDKKVENQWLVVFAKRYGERSLKQSDEIEKILRNLFGSSTVKTFDGKMTIFQAKELFNKAKVYVAGHGAAMTNMFFMPKDGFVLELRPKNYPNSCFHFLAEVSELNYYLLLGDGNKHTQIDVNVTDVGNVLKQIYNRTKHFFLKGQD